MLHTHALTDELPGGEEAQEGHSVHTPPAIEYVPAAHVAHATLEVAPAGEDLPAAHALHAALPVTVFHVPGAHAEHELQYESGPVYPAGHCCSCLQPPYPFPAPHVPAFQEYLSHLSQVVDPSYENVITGQS